MDLVVNYDLKVFVWLIYCYYFCCYLIVFCNNFKLVFYLKFLSNMYIYKVY